LLENLPTAKSLHVGAVDRLRHVFNKDIYIAVLRIGAYSHTCSPFLSVLQNKPWKYKSKGKDWEEARSLHV